MSKNKKNKKNKKRTGWGVPKNAIDYFDPHYDDDFKEKHPILYWLTVLAIIILSLVGPILYLLLCNAIQSEDFYEGIIELIAWIFGFIASFGISIALCNVFMIVHEQYLGHYVTLYSFLVGIAGPGVALLFLWLI
jgi:hypothetical protein